ncbi:MAG TPA: DUF4352 domain-containing protein [Streptosporangiaceae bacterium]|jgi:hypothetical protein
MIAFTVAGVTLGTALAGCTAGSGPAPSPAPAASPTYPLPPRPVRLSETPVAGATAVSEQTSVAVIGVRAHMPLLAGTHADFQPRGEFDRLRVVVQNDSRTFLSLTPADMLLVTADGTAHRPDGQAMVIKRQPEAIELGSQGRVEFDLYYDVPTGSKLRLLRLAGFDPKLEIPLPAT